MIQADHLATHEHVEDGHVKAMPGCSSEESRVIVAARSNALECGGNGNEHVASRALHRPAVRQNLAQGSPDSPLACVRELVDRSAGDARQRSAPLELEQRRE